MLISLLNTIVNRDQVRWLDKFGMKLFNRAVNVPRRTASRETRLENTTTCALTAISHRGRRYEHPITKDLIKINILEEFLRLRSQFTKTCAAPGFARACLLSYFVLQRPAET